MPLFPGRRQFRREAADARERGGRELPSGVTSTSRFVRVWCRLGVAVSPEQAAALFVRGGCDASGLLRTAAFADTLLAGAPLPARSNGGASPGGLLKAAGVELEQVGPYRAGDAAAHKGRIVYAPCRSPVWPPTTWDGALALRSARLPKVRARQGWTRARGLRASSCAQQLQRSVRPLGADHQLRPCPRRAAGAPSPAS
jgi:hypothetical protein